MNLDDFLLYIASEKGLSQNTIDAYKHDIELLLAFLKRNSIHAFNDVKEADLIGFLSELKSYYKDTSIYRIFVACKVFFRFLKRENAVEKDITYYLNSPKFWQLIPEVLTVEEIEKLFQACDKKTADGARDLAILELLYASGLRVTEACTVKISDVDDTFVKVMGKGRKERIVPLGKCALNAIDHYLIHFRKETDDRNDFLFLNNKGKPVDRSFIWSMVKKYGKKANILKNISPHTLRHSFATHLLDNGADIRIIQECLGHASIGTTERYTHISRSHLQSAFNSCHPRL